MLDELLPVLIPIALVLFGLVVGSFLNVVAYRVPLGKSVAHPPSACPTCDSPIAPRDNIPVVSWLALRGRCRHCGEPISARYPLVEAGHAALWVLTYLVVGVEWVLIGYLWFVSVSLTLILTDLDHHRIPNRILYPGFLVGLILLAVGALLDGEPARLLPALGGAAGYFMILFVVALASRGGFGFGDVKLAALLGLFTGYVGLGSALIAFFLGIFIGGVVAIVLLALRRRDRKAEIAFGPPMIVGAWIAVPYGADLLARWLGIA